jgi:2-isopropylmalate synthase
MDMSVRWHGQQGDIMRENLTASSRLALALEEHYGISLPPSLQQEFASVVSATTSPESDELRPAQVWDIFQNEYFSGMDLIFLSQYRCFAKSSFSVVLEGAVSVNGHVQNVRGLGTGPIDAYRNALLDVVDLHFDILDFQQQARGVGSQSEAIAIVKIHTGERRSVFGVSMHEDSVRSSLEALTSAVNRAYRALSATHPSAGRAARFSQNALGTALHPFECST